MNHIRRHADRKLEAELAKWRATRKVALWMTAAILLFITAQVVMIVLERETIGGLLSSSIGLVLFSGLLLHARRRVRAIAAQISS
jgi:hypothetical protein